MNIDWNKAPEGATHFAPAHGVFTALWAKKEGAFWWFRISDSKDHDWYFGVQPMAFENFIQHPPTQEWTGEGLPPVGTVCERSFSHSTWKKTTICGHSTDGAYASFYDGDGLMGWDDNCRFRPIRTPEQIAAEERDKVVAQMTEASLYGHYAFTKAQAEIACRTLYDAGYRKFEIVDDCAHTTSTTKARQ